MRKFREIKNNKNTTCLKEIPLNQNSIYLRHTYMRKFREIKTFTLILKALLNPLAKKPPNGPMTEAKIDINNECNKNG